MLVKIKGDSIKVKVIEIGLTEVKYKNYDDLSGITYGIYKTEVKLIRYENGRVERFDRGDDADKNLSPEEKCNCGRSDAANYHGQKGGAFACGVWCGPFAMLGTALVKQTPQLGLRTVKMSQHKVLFNDPSYLKCYNKKAKSDLINMEFQGFIVAILVPVAIVYLIYH